MTTRKEKPELETGNTGERARRRAWTAACSTGTSEPTMHERAERISRARGWGLAEPLSDDCWPVMFVPDGGRVEPVCLPPAILAALDPNRPLTLDRWVRGAIRYGLADDDQSARIMLADVWACGAEDYDAG